MLRSHFPRTKASDWFAPAIFAVALAITVACYAPGVTGSYHFDDAPNLAGLAEVGGFQSGISFITEGTSGPLGRPISLMTFAGQAYAWPDSPETFLKTNVAIHLLNGALVLWLLTLISRARGSAQDHGQVVAALGSTIWLLLPILASSSLLIIQRMATLSATFMLAGLVSYLASRILAQRRPVVGLMAMTASIGAGTALAVLTKETGALLPAYALVIECTLLSRPKRITTRLWRLWRSTVLALPCVILAIYVIAQVQYSDPMITRRGFDAGDRFLTQLHILWHYLRQSFVPEITQLGPFHDDQQVYTTWFTIQSGLVVLSWVAIATSALYLRKRYPLYSFAVAWFLAGHFLESTFLPLELYFEHRNYMPLIGPCMAIAAAVVASHKKCPKIVVTLVSAYTATLAITLYSFTSLWGSPALAAEMWSIHKPESRRATQYLSEQLQITGDYGTAQRVLSSYSERHPNDAGVRLQVLGLSCITNSGEPDALVTHMLNELTATSFSHALSGSLHTMHRLLRDGHCQSLDNATIYMLARALAQNPNFTAHPIVGHNLHILMAELMIEERDLETTMMHIERALSSYRAVSTVRFGAEVLVSAGLYTEAITFVKETYDHVPRNPIRAANWRRQLNDLVSDIERIIAER